MEFKLYDHIPETDIYLFNTGNAQKAWLSFGCTYDQKLRMHRFLVWAPNAKSVSVVGDFNAWNEDATPMEKTVGGVWAAFVPGLNDGDLYKYCVVGADGVKHLKSDPFANYCQSRENTASVVWCRRKYTWHDKKYLSGRSERRFNESPMSIYEVHAGSWRQYDEEKHTYRLLADELSRYCKTMGFTHVELLPINEYPYDGSWGYQVTGYYAPTSRYGTPEDFKYFVDTMHAAGIGVIIDWVPAHFPRDEHGLSLFDGTALYECSDPLMASHPEWGTLIFDYASKQVQSFLISSACKLTEVYHVDGIRVDAVTSMLYLDYCRKPGEFTPNKNGGNINLDAVEFLKKLNKTLLTNYPGTVTVAEESSAYPNITAPVYDGGLGFCLKWDMGFMHDTLDYMTLDPYFRSYNHDKLTFSMMYAFSENYVLAYSHDEVVHGKKSMLDKMSGEYDMKFSSLRTLYGYQFAHPGKKLTFMGSEFGQFIEWDFKQGLDWLLLKYPRHSEMQRFTAKLNKIYTHYPAMWQLDRSWDGFKWLNVNDRERSTVAFMRTGKDETKKSVVCVCNFTPVRYDDFVIALPERGKMKLILNSDEYCYGGSGCECKKTVKTLAKPFIGMDYSAKLTVPAMSVIYYEFVPDNKGGNVK